MTHKFNIGAVVYYRPKDRMLSTARGTYTITGLMPGLEGHSPNTELDYCPSFCRDLYFHGLQRLSAAGLST